MKKIMFVTYGGGHVNIIKSIYKKLILKEKIYIEILALTMAPQVLRDAKIPYHTISEYLDIFHNKKQIIETGQQLALKEHNENSGIAYMDTVAYMGFGYLDLCNQYGTEKAKQIFLEHGRKAFLPIHTMATILKYTEPNIVVITTSPRMEKAAAIAANQLNIPVVRINDLPFMTEKPAYDCTVCVMNQYAKKQAVQNNYIQENRIVVTGQPVFEDDLKISSAEKQKYKQYLGRFSKIILYLAQPGVAETQNTLDILKQMSSKYDKYAFIVRPHPNDDFNYRYEQTDNFFVTKEGELKYLLSICDIAVTHSSTSGLEAALMGKPLITVLVSTKSILRFDEFGIAVNVDTFANLENTILECLNSHSSVRKRLWYGYQDFKNVDNASNNIIDVIFHNL